VIRAHAFYLRITNRAKEAQEAFEPLLALEPRDAGLRVSYAGILDANGDIKGALRQYREAILLEPGRVQPYHWAGSIALMTIGTADVGLRLLRRASSLDPDNPDIPAALAGVYWYFGDAELSQQALGELRKLGATATLQGYEATFAQLDERPDEARSLLLQILKGDPRDANAMYLLAISRGSSDEYRYALQQVTQYRSLDSETLRSDQLVDALVCLNAWIGNLEEAHKHLAGWESIWRTRHAYGFMSEGARYDKLARSLACVGRKDDSLTELESLVKDGLNMLWRYMAVDPAYDDVRNDPRFLAITAQLKAADAGAWDRFRARKDLNDTDIESLGM